MGIDLRAFMSSVLFYFFRQGFAKLLSYLGWLEIVILLPQLCDPPPRIIGLCYHTWLVQNLK